jgi:putative membrane protein
MSPPQPGSLAAVLAALGHGLPALLPSFVATLVLLAIGVGIYVSLTRFRERELIREGNTAAALVLAGVVLALAIPLAALLATSGALLDIIVWGIVALALQLLTFGAISVLFGDLHQMIEANNTAAGLVVAGSHIAVALLNAAAMVPT